MTFGYLMRGQAFPLLLLVLSCARAQPAPLPKAESTPPASSVVPPPALSPKVVVANDFEIALVDDSGRLAALQQGGEAPAGVSLVEDRLNTREGDVLHPLFVRLELQGGESLVQGLSRIAAWLEPVHLPPEERLAWGPVLEGDADGHERLVAYRSYVLFAPSIVAKDVIEARVNDDQPEFPGVSLQLSREAAKVFQTLTRDHRKERLAMVVKGLVQAAPVVQAEIPGGRVMVSGGGTTPEEMRAGAEALVNVLKGPAK